MSSIFNKSKFALIFFLFTQQLLASDNISPSEIGLLFERKVKESHSFTAIFREEIKISFKNLDSTNLISLAQFYNLCKSNHIFLSNFPEAEAELEFFQDSEILENYMSKDWPEDLWTIHYFSAVAYFVEGDNFLEAQRYLLKINETNKTLARKGLAGILVSKHQELWTKEGFSLINNLESIYRNVRKAQGVTEFKDFDAIDCIHLAYLSALSLRYKDSLKYAQKALELGMPDSNDPFLGVEASADSLINNIAMFYYKLGHFEIAKSILIEQKNLSPQDFKTLACIFAFEKSWDVSFKYFILMLESPSIVYINHDESDVLITMFMRRSVKEFNKYAKRFSYTLKEIFPLLEEDINALMLNFKNRREAGALNAIKRAIANETFLDLAKLYKVFDHLYQNLWAQSSLVPNDLLPELLAPVHALAEEILSEYSVLMKLQSGHNYAEDIGNIMDIGRQLREHFALFSSRVRESDHAISKVRRKLFIERNKISGENNEPFIESGFRTTSKSLKSQVLSEQKAAQDIAAKKLHVKESKENRNYIENHHKTQIKENLSTIMTPNQNKIFLFKDSHLEYLFVANELDNNTLEMLKALKSAESIYHLRTLLLPGTKLEILKGDRKGQISLRVNDQYRLCFTWISGQGAYNIELVDYH